MRAALLVGAILFSVLFHAGIASGLGPIEAARRMRATSVADLETSAWLGMWIYCLLLYALLAVASA